MILNMTGGTVLRSFIAVTYPAGSVCTCTDGEKTLTARDTSGYALFNVGLGTWTVGITDETHTIPVTKTVSITQVGQGVSVEMSYGELYWDGPTGGVTWEVYRGINPNAKFDPGSPSEPMTLAAQNVSEFVAAGITTPISLKGFSTVHFYGRNRSGWPTGGYVGNNKLAKSSVVVSFPYGEVDFNERTIDISDPSYQTGAWYIYFGTQGAPELTEILRCWLT